MTRPRSRVGQVWRQHGEDDPDRFTYLVVRSVRVSDSRWKHYCLTIGVGAGYRGEVGQVQFAYESERSWEHEDDADELLVDPLELEEG